MPVEDDDGFDYLIGLYKKDKYGDSAYRTRVSNTDLIKFKNNICVIETEGCYGNKHYIVDFIEQDITKLYSRTKRFQPIDDIAYTILNKGYVKDIVVDIVSDVTIATINYCPSAEHDYTLTMQGKGFKLISTPLVFSESDYEPEIPKFRIQ